MWCTHTPKLMNPIATMWKGRVRFDTPMLFCIGFLLIFLLGGITGVMVAMMPFDWQVTDSYFVVAHFHYVLNGAVVFPIFGALYYWWPKVTGHMLNERLGRISFWTMFASFNATFFPMHILGFLGMPRRIYTYGSGLGWDGLNLFVSIAAFVFGLGAMMTLVNLVWNGALKHGAPAGNDPWGADSLEWQTTSPPPDWNFAAIPIVRSRHPNWDQERPYAAEAEGPVVRTPGVAGALARETPFSDGYDADPEATFAVPRPTYLPFALACGLLIIVVGLLISAAAVGLIGLALGAVALGRWAWRTGDTEIMPPNAAQIRPELEATNE
jgi:heme/copper-type cytochrome/quinol oxidase subunit 1